MKELTNRVGLTDFFGIFSPGVFVLIAFALCIIGLAHIFQVDINTLETVNSVLKSWMVFINILALFASYLFGSVIRLFANDFAEVLSGFYLTKLRKKKSPIARERFPYPFAGGSFESSNPEIYRWYKERYEYFAEEDQLDPWDRKYFFNKCKVDLYARSPERSQFYERIESFVRFLAGALVSCIILFNVTLPFGIYFFMINSGFLATVYITFAIFSLTAVISILERFRNQHTREVMTLWTSYYEACCESEKRKKQSKRTKKTLDMPQRP